MASFRDSSSSLPAECREIPQAPGPEKGVLALLAMDPATYMSQAVAFGVTEDFFHIPAHQLLWRLFLARYNGNQPLDIISMTQALADMRQLDAVGGNAGLAEIYTFTTTGAYFEHYLRTLRDKSLLRSIIDASAKSMTQAFDNPEDVAALLDAVETHIFQIRERSKSRADGQSLASLVREAVTSFEQFIASKGRIQGLSTGFDLLDKKSNGLKPGDMFVIAARPSMGKTSFLLNIMEHVALNEKKPTLLFSCEMPAVQIVERLLFARSGVRRGEIVRRGTLTPLEMQHFKRAVEDVGAAQLVIDDTAAISITELRAKARRVMRDLGGLAVIGVDYLQLMRSHSKQAANSREREVAEISAGLKALAKELKVPVVVLAQLNRGPETRAGKEAGIPRMSDLRESGSIEQDADMIGLLYRSDYYAEDEDQRQQLAGQANLHLAKNRNGPTGDIPLRFEAELMRFSTREPKKK